MRNAQTHPQKDAVVFWSADEEPFRWRWSALIQTAQQIAGILLGQGLSKGDVCAIMLFHHRYFYPVYMAIEAIGAIPSVLAPPNQRLHPEKFRQGIIGMSVRSGLKWLLTDRSLEPIVRPIVLEKKSSIKDIFFPLEWLNGKIDLRETVSNSSSDLVSEDETCLLQHSSGTTGLQKAVMLSHRSVLEHVRRYAQAIDLKQDDKIVSWLPLYHDMGLIAAFHLPLAYGITTVQVDPLQWVAAPVLFMEAVHKESATLAWLPNFAYNLMAERIRDEAMAGIRLDSLRLLINCSEPLRYESHEKFATRFAPYGFKRNCLGGCYAMAETTFAVTQSWSGRETVTVEASRLRLSKGEFQSPEPGEVSRICVSSGRLIEGCKARIVSERGEDLEDGRVGEVVVSSVSLFDGYRNNPEKTKDVLRDGWYWTGDLGFKLENEFFIIGRKKDIIIVAGNNIYPEDIEDAINHVPGVIPGRIVAFGMEDGREGTEKVCVVAETSLVDEAEKKALQRNIVEAGRQIDVTINHVYLVPSRWLIKSSAGKPSRSANSQRVLSELI